MIRFNKNEGIQVTLVKLRKIRRKRKEDNQQWMPPNPVDLAVDSEITFKELRQKSKVTANYLKMRKILHSKGDCH